MILQLSVGGDLPIGEGERGGEEAKGSWEEAILIGWETFWPAPAWFLASSFGSGTFCVFSDGSDLASSSGISCWDLLLWAARGPPAPAEEETEGVWAGLKSLLEGDLTRGDDDGWVVAEGEDKGEERVVGGDAVRCEATSRTPERVRPLY